MAIRCRNFDDDGKPVTKRGCAKGAECPFIHPDNSAWAQAGRRQNSDVNSNRFSGPSRSRRGSLGGPPKPASKEWDTSLWGLASGTSKKTDDGPTTRNWGSMPARKDATSESQNRGASNEWNKISDKGETSGSGAEGNSGGDSSWGTTGGWGMDKSMGWGGSGSGDGGWGNGRASVGEGWGGVNVGDNTSTVPSENDQKGKRKEREDVEMRDSSPSRIVGSLKRIPLSNNKSEFATPAPPPTQSSPPLSTVSSKPARPRPLPLPSRQKKTQILEDGSLAKMALQCVKILDRESELVQEKSSTLPTKTVNGPKGRADLFSQLIKHTSTVVFTQIELERAQRDYARWKRTQESAQYERASHATRVILDHHRAKLNHRVQEAKRRLDRALTALVELPDFASRNHKTPGPILTKQTIEAYTAELRDWFSDLELHKRILMEKAASEAELSPEPVQGDSAPPVELQLTARQLVERGKWSWNDIKNAIDELDTRVLATAEHLYSDVYTTIADLKDQVVGLHDPRPLNPPATRGNQCSALSSTVTLVGDNLSAQAIRTAELISRIHELEQEREQLENETRAMDKLCAEVEVHFSQFEQWRQDDRAKIQEMAEQLRTLHLRRKTPKTPTATLQSAQLDEILLRMRPIVVSHLQKEVQAIFDALRNRCLENHDGMKSLIEELVKPALTMTDDICHRVSAMSSHNTMRSN